MVNQLFNVFNALTYLLIIFVGQFLDVCRWYTLSKLVLFDSMAARWAI